MEINLVELDLTSLRQLQGGTVFRTVQKLLAMAVADCESRPTESRPRKVLLCLEIKPVSHLEDLDDHTTRHVIDSLKLRLKHDVKFPSRETIEFDCGLGEGHKLLFNPDSPHNHRQAALPFTVDADAIVPMKARVSG